MILVYLADYPGVCTGLSADRIHDFIIARSPQNPFSNSL